MMNLANLRIVLVGTTHPGNIGASARAMKNMGLERLVLVAPSCFPHADATARASGADDILANARVVARLDDALMGCGLVFGASARRRTLPWPEVDPHQCALRAVSASAHGEVALVFGRERAGLTNEELDRCHFLVHIPANPHYRSLNLAAAVQVLAYEVRMAAREEPAGAIPPWTSAQAPADEMERLYRHLEEVLVETGFLDPDNPRFLMRRLRRLFNRARPDCQEVNILRGILAAIQGRKQSKQSR
jgi:TrmH family RNA methyltransferase